MCTPSVLGEGSIYTPNTSLLLHIVVRKMSKEDLKTSIFPNSGLVFFLISIHPAPAKGNVS